MYKYQHLKNALEATKSICYVIRNNILNIQACQMRRNFKSMDEMRL